MKFDNGDTAVVIIDPQIDVFSPTGRPPSARTTREGGMY
jgi:hypothetical protein